MHPLARLCPLVFLAGGCCVPPLLNVFSNSKTNSPKSSVQQTSVSVTEPTSQVSSPETAKVNVPHTEPTVESHDNCVVDEEQAFSKWLDKSYTYVFFVCSNGGREDKELSGTWKVWIPTVLLNEERGPFKKGQKVNIKTHTTSLSENSFGSKTKFESKIFVKPETKGQWGTNLVEDDSNFLDPQVYKIEVLDSELKGKFMYLQY